MFMPARKPWPFLPFTTHNVITVRVAIPLRHPFAAARLGPDDLHAVPGLDDLIGVIAELDVVPAGDAVQPPQTALGQWHVPFQRLRSLQLGH
ncbi:hypothetical protein D3C75_1275910 [compost metagenome]